MQLADLWRTLASDLGRTFEVYRSELSSLRVSTKADDTLLTTADIAVQDLIINHIRSIDPYSPIIAEEDDRKSVRSDVLAAPGKVWVIDPIDGTSEFVDSARVEFCSVVCLVEDGAPTSAFIYLPELISGRPTLITADARRGTVLVNDDPAKPALHSPPSLLASVTRSSGAAEPDFARHLTSAGYRIKEKATSQTVDLVRTAIDLRRQGLTDQLPTFDLFWRRDQKVWDGLAGLCLGRILGLSCLDGSARSRLPLTTDLLSLPEPKLDTTIMGRPEVLEWLTSQR